MTPAARLQMAIEILEALETTAQPTDRFLTARLRTRRFAGPGDRRAIAERVFSAQRHHAALAHRMGDERPRDLMIAALLESGEDIEALFTGGYGPAPLTEAARTAIATTPGHAPDWVRGAYPARLESELSRAYGDRLAEELQAIFGCV